MTPSENSQDQPLIRCIDCRSEFSEAEIKDSKCCPKCGSTSFPLAVNEDVVLNINLHELRILTFWAERWAAEDKDMQKTLKSIVNGLNTQFPGFPFSLEAEAQRIATAVGLKIIVVTGTGVKKFDPEEMN